MLSSPKGNTIHSVKVREATPSWTGMVGQEMLLWYSQSTITPTGGECPHIMGQSQWTVTDADTVTVTLPLCLIYIVDLKCRLDGWIDSELTVDCCWHCWLISVNKLTLLIAVDTVDGLVSTNRHCWLFWINWQCSLLLTWLTTITVFFFFWWSFLFWLYVYF